MESANVKGAVLTNVSNLKEGLHPLQSVQRRKTRMEPTDPAQVGSERYCVLKSPSEIVWFPLASIANTSKM